MNKPINGEVRRRGIYVLPSLFTTMGLFAGFYALIAAIQGRYELAAWAIIVAAIFDMLDGRVARLLHAETAFGAEYDSLSDMLSFGIAPAVLVYLWALTPLHKPGWLAAFLIAACAALRLARFNTQVGKMDKRYFQGLPTPATALLIATAVLFHEDGGLQPLSWLWFGISVVLAWLMVSRVRFVSGKDIDLKKRRPFVVVLAFLAVIFFVMINPYRVLFMLLLAYVLHGVILSLWQKRRAFQMRARLRRRRHEHPAPGQGADERPAPAEPDEAVSPKH
jgi:CDP-diacylglycerol--serine O-phosphatidyltransferase